MEYKLTEIENLKLPESGRVSGTRMRCILEAITCIIAEYAIDVLKYDVSDETLYPYIRKYFEGEFRSKDLLKKFRSNYEIAAFFDIIPDIEKVSFDDYLWREALEKITVSCGANNVYRIGNRVFQTKKMFFHVITEDKKQFAQRYFKSVEDEKVYFVRIGDDGVSSIIEKPYEFAAVKNAPLHKNITCLDEDAFFRLDEIKSSDQDQRDAITASVHKNLVVLAGAGSGKTRTLVSRLAYLHLVKGIPLSKIVLLTFTTAAADEMQAKAEKLIKQIYAYSGIDKQPYVYAKTFDAFFRKILLDYFGEIGFTETPELDLSSSNTDRKINILREVIIENQMQGIFAGYMKDANSMYGLLNQMENYAIGLTVNQPGVDRLLDLFLKKQVENNIVLGFFYVNLLVKNSLYQENSLLKEAMMMRYSCFLIDEFQDISSLQNDTLKIFYDTDIHFTFVGDDDQSIYAWRGADVSIIQDIVNSEDTDTKYLLINYRNNPNIVKAGNCILRLIDNRAKNNDIIPYKTSGSKIRVSKNDDKYTNIVDEIDRFIKNGCEPKEISVLTRKGKQAQNIINALSAINIPVASQNTVIELDIYYYLLKALINIKNDYDVYRSCKQIMRFAKDESYTELEIYKIIHGEISCQGNMEVIQNIALDMFRINTNQLANVVERYAEKAGEEFARIAYGKINSKTLDAFADYCRDGEIPWPVAHKRLSAIYSTFENARGRRNSANRKMENGVSVSTIHHAKGLEYNIVMITGLNQGEYPNITLIDNEYNKKVQELEALKNARTEYYELKKRITDVRLKGLIADCDNTVYSIDEKEKIKPLSEFLKNNLRGLRQLNADAIEDFLDVYQQCIIPIEREYGFEQARLARKILEIESLLEQKKEEWLLIDEGNVEIREQKELEIRDFTEEIEREKAKLESVKSKMLLFEKAISNLKSFNNTSFIASGLLADMSKAEEIEFIKKQLEKEKNIKIAEERRTFYVAVTRARDHLYLFSDTGAVESEFIGDIDDSLKTEYTTLTKNERKEFERMAGVLREEFRKAEPDEESVDLKIDNIINDSLFKEHISDKYKEYLKEHPLFTKLSKEAARYFRQGMSLLFVGELTGADFSTEFAHNVQKAAEIILEEAAGENAVPFKTDDYKQMEKISRKIRKDAEICNFQIPSRKFIEDIISSDVEKNRMDSLKKAGIEHYIVRSHQFKVKKEVYSTWKMKKINGNAQKFLCAILDLSNVRNMLVHEKEDRWPEDAVTSMLNNFTYILKCCK